MLLVKFIVACTLWAWSAVAFYPYLTPSYCKEIGGCYGTNDAGSFSVKVSQRRSKSNSPHGLRISRYLGRLMRKDQNSKRGTVNQYPVVHSNTPTTPYSVAIDQDGSDFSYFATVKFGSAGTPLEMLMDTGASDSWVMGANCNSAACNSHDTYDTTKSTSFTLLNNTFSVAYGTGSVAGQWGSDTISFANLTLDLDFGIANETSDDFVNFSMDGILGLSISENTYPPFILALQNAKLLKSNIFAINLNRAEDGAVDGELTFGQLDTAKFVGDITYVPLAGGGPKWGVQIDSMLIGGQPSLIQNRTAFIDTGTSFMFIPLADAAALHDQIKGAVFDTQYQTWQVPCTGQSDLQLVIGGVSFPISVKDWVGDPIAKGSLLCASNVYPGEPAGTGNWLLGDTFLKNVYTVFDTDQSRLGFGNKNGSQAPASSSAPSPSPSLSAIMTSGSTQTSGSGVTSDSLATTGSPTASLAAPSSSGTSGGFDAAVTSKSTSPDSPGATATSTSSSSPTPSPNSAARFEGTHIVTVLAIFIAMVLGS